MGEALDRINQQREVLNAERKLAMALRSAIKGVEDLLTPVELVKLLDQHSNDVRALRAFILYPEPSAEEPPR